MTNSRELEVQEKKELSSDEETTIQVRYYMPPTDIFETDEALTMVLEMPGVSKDDISVDLENDQLAIEGKLDFSKYDDLEPLYTEYNVGHYKRTFSLSNKINQDKISADLKDGVLTLVLPKSEAYKPRKIAVN